MENIIGIFAVDRICGLPPMRKNAKFAKICGLDAAYDCGI